MYVNISCLIKDSAEFVSLSGYASVQNKRTKCCLPHHKIYRLIFDPSNSLTHMQTQTHAHAQRDEERPPHLFCYIWDEKTDGPRWKKIQNSIRVYKKKSHSQETYWLNMSLDRCIADDYQTTKYPKDHLSLSFHPLFMVELLELLTFL